MTKILITGKNSYIGNSFENFMKQFSDNYQIDTIDMKDGSWENKDFSKYDVVFHVAGIAHADISKVSEDTKNLYYRVNTELTIEVAEKFKLDRKGKESQFVFMSSIIVYGEGTSLRVKRIITKDTKPNPSNFYGDSKLKAELGLEGLNSSDFKVVILRPPMIYGKGCKGNYKQLERIANTLPIFPDIKNERSMLAINSLCVEIKTIIDNNKSGIFFPQDEEYVQTSQMVKKIAESNKKKIILFSWMNWFIYLLSYFPGKIGKIVNKAFGNLIYSKDIDFKDDIL